MPMGCTELGCNKLNLFCLFSFGLWIYWENWNTWRLGLWLRSPLVEMSPALITGLQTFASSGQGVRLVVPGRFPGLVCLCNSKLRTIHCFSRLAAFCLPLSISITLICSRWRLLTSWQKVIVEIPGFLLTVWILLLAFLLWRTGMRCVYYSGCWAVRTCSFCLPWL